MKICKKCGIEIFGHGLKEYCGKCRKEVKKTNGQKWKENNRERLREDAKIYAEQNKTKRTVYRKKYEQRPEVKERIKQNLFKNKLKREYNLTIEDYSEFVGSQNGCCAICGRHQSIFGKKLDIDHCHINGIVRGLLCNQCNQALGLFKDNIDILASAISYLQNGNIKIRSIA